MYTDLSMRIDTADSIIYSYADCVCLRACAGTRGLIIWYGVFFGCSVYNGKQYILDIFACHNNTVSKLLNTQFWFEIHLPQKSIPTS